MKYDDRILGLFFSDESNLIYDNVKNSESLDDNKKNQLNMLSFKFLGPVFLTAASTNGNKWNIELIESALTHYQGQIFDIIQSFFNLNSSIATKDGITNLFALIGSPHTEDLNEIYNILTKYVHPSIIQGKIVNEDLLGNRFNFHKFIQFEMIRGLHLIDYSLGSSRKVYWEPQHEYSCVGLIERTIINGNEDFYLYTYDENNSLRKEALGVIPSYYIMVVLPEYYENLINETLGIFNKPSLFANIRLINLSNQKHKVIYIEEFKCEKNVKKSYGAILVQDCEALGEPNKISYYKKNLRLILDGNKDLNESLNLLNNNFVNTKWANQTDEDLNKIRRILDNLDN